MNHRIAVFVAISVSIIALVGACLPPLAHAQSTSTREKLHADAVAAFQHGRFPEAYGRFIGLADAGDAPAAEVALFMFDNGPSLFGRDWDVTQEQLTAWAALTGRPAPVLQPLIYPRTVAPVVQSLR